MHLEDIECNGVPQLYYARSLLSKSGLGMRHKLIVRTMNMTLVADHYIPGTLEYTKSIMDKVLCPLSRIIHYSEVQLYSASVH